MVDRRYDIQNEELAGPGFGVWKVYKAELGGQKIERWISLRQDFKNEVDAIGYAMEVEYGMLPMQKLGVEIVAGPIVGDLNKKLQS